jgi:hypothetical protein
MNSRRKKKIRKTGFKKITVKFPRIKIKKRGSGLGEKDHDFVPQNTQKRRDGRKIRTMKRMAEQGKAA